MRWFRRTPIGSARWVVLDCETSGLDAAQDRLLSVGAVAVAGGEIRLADRFSAVVAQAVASAPENILIHGIGGDEQRAGRPLAEIIAELHAYIGEGVPVAFHAPFDAGVLRRHGLRARTDWVDLATLMPVCRKPRPLWLPDTITASPSRHTTPGSRVTCTTGRTSSTCR